MEIEHKYTIKPNEIIPLSHSFLFFCMKSLLASSFYFNESEKKTQIWLPTLLSTHVNKKINLKFYSTFIYSWYPGKLTRYRTVCITCSPFPEKLTYAFLCFPMTFIMTSSRYYFYRASDTFRVIRTKRSVWVMLVMCYHMHIYFSIFVEKWLDDVCSSAKRKLIRIGSAITIAGIK